MERTRQAGPSLRALIGVFLVLATSAAIAHHSASLYDFENLITVEGTVKEFQWTNPHVIVWLEVDGEDGKEPQLWAIQATSPGNLRRNGWAHDSLKPGDHVRVELAPLRNGKPGGGLSKVTFVETGEVISMFGKRRAREYRPSD